VSEEADDREARMAEAVRLIVTRRERAPRSPRLERAFKRLIWRYTLGLEAQQPDADGKAEERKEGRQK
jgi:hypothetical protein